MVAIFTVDELLSLKRVSLNHLADYYKVDHAGLSKEELVSKLMDVLIKEEQAKEGSPMSPRVLTAMESIKNG